MIDFPLDMLDESPRLRKLFNAVIDSAAKEYQNESSATGRAIRELLGALRNPSDELWAELKVKPTERMQYNNVANAAHLRLKA